jgi:hypothetical protein
MEGDRLAPRVKIGDVDEDVPQDQHRGGGALDAYVTLAHPH